MDKDTDSLGYDISFEEHSFDYVADLTCFIRSDQNKVSTPIKCQNCSLHENRT